MARPTPTTERGRRFRSLEGSRVNLALVDGSRMDDCKLVAAARQGVDSLWVFTNGTDVFVPLADVADLWEVEDGVPGR